MKKSCHPNFRCAHLATADRAVALVIVLAIVVLLTALIVGFMLRAGSERASASNYRTVASTRELADAAVNLVEAQINHATTQGSATVWASQPGAVRLFDSTGALTRIYRLYSARTVTTTMATDLDGDVPPSTWAMSPAIWTDLNAPVTTTLPGASGTQTCFPILDPRDPNNPANIVTMDGFALDSPPGATTTQPAPMPTRWLYLLQNGEIIAPDDSGNGKQLTFTGAAVQPSKADPIVGRVAYWTDDDSCRININTASAGNATFWDTPRFRYSDEAGASGSGLALYAPTVGEYQRYPGHPATTTLSKVLTAVNANLTSTDLFNLCPRFTYGGSKEATVPVQTSATIPTSPKNAYRLYTSAGEMLFDKDRQVNGSTAPNKQLTRQQLETARFFLTAHSAAPEVNAFGKPRVCIWPLSDSVDAQHRSAIDQLIAFCSTLNGKLYEFTRAQRGSVSADVQLARNQQLMSYLDLLTSTAIPGFGGDFKTKYGSDQRQILTEIFDYIRSTNLRDPSNQPGSTAAIIPYGDADSTQSYTAGAGQVIPTVNPTINGTAWNTQGFGRFPRVSEASILLVGMGQGQNTVDGTAAFPVPSDQIPAYTGTLPNNTTAVQAFFLLNFFDPAQGYSSSNPSFTIQVQGLDGFQLVGSDGTSYAFHMPPTSSMYLGGETGKFTNVPIRLYYSGAYRGGGIIDFRSTFMLRPLGRDHQEWQFPFYSDIVAMPNLANPTLATLAAAPLTIKLYAGKSTSAADLIQTYQINFPAQRLPLPLVEPAQPNAPGDHRRFGTNDMYFPTTPTSAAQVDRAAFAYVPEQLTKSFVINPACDTIFSMVPNSTYADYRLLATSTVPSTAFVPHPAAGSLSAGTSRMAYGLRTSTGLMFTSATSGHLVPSSNTNTDYPDVTPATLNGAWLAGGTTLLGDWDNGVADYPDGPYINRPDEGNLNISATSSVPYFGDSASTYSPLGGTYFSPNRQVPSPVIFGSLSSGVTHSSAGGLATPLPWQTLLFRPDPGSHAGGLSPKDHLLLDLFWMPVAEPYAISEPCATAGKVNLNYQIVPFSYITRSTAIQSVLASEKVAQVSKGQAAVYKRTTNSGQARYNLKLSDRDGTLRQFKERFTSREVFKSASEVCDVFLVPANESWTSDASARASWYGDNYALVGDNTRERPYADIYSRVTTKSNVYTVYFTVQTLKSVASDPSRWDEAKGTVTGEYRGSTTLERYLDPNGTTIPDYANYANFTSSNTLDTFYKWRVVSNSQFAP